MTTKLTDKNISNVANLGLQWQGVITADGSTTTTGVAGRGYFIDTTSAAHTINLPASATAGDTVAIKDYAGTFATNNLTIGRNGHNIQGVTNDSQISTARANVELVYIDSTKGWLYTNESNVGDLEIGTFIAATGGTVTTSGDYKLHTFTGDGNFVVSSIGGGSTPCIQASKVDYLVVAGGGAGGGPMGGDSAGGGGGGAGGFRVSNQTCMPTPTTSPLANPTGLTVSAQTYPVTVGAGGSPSVPSGPYAGGNGSNSVFSTITSAGGGGGGGNPNSPVPFRSGQPGGSGGGAGRAPGGPNPGGTGNTPPVSPSQGNPGGDVDTCSSAPHYGQGGGGGAGSAGNIPVNQTSSVGGSGGIGSFVSPSLAGSNGTPGPVSDTRYFSGGGGGSTYQGGGTPGAGGAGGGGAGNNAPGGNPTSPGVVGVSGTANTGGGGGGMSQLGTGGAGGKGIVILRYKFQ